jgi:hypothetical protein
MGDVDTGVNTLESERRKLQGTWELVTLDLYSNGKPTPAQANARLVYDEYGNVTIKGTITGSAVLEPSALNATGRVTIDPVAHTFRFMNIESATADDRRVDPKIDATRVRHYEFVGETLKTTIKGADGSTSSVATWKKVS